MGTKWMVKLEKFEYEVYVSYYYFIIVKHFECEIVAYTDHISLLFKTILLFLGQDIFMSQIL